MIVSSHLPLSEMFAFACKDGDPAEQADGLALWCSICSRWHSIEMPGLPTSVSKNFCVCLLRR